MKKTLYFIAIFTFFISCTKNEEAIDEINELQLTKVESQYYNQGTPTFSGTVNVESNKFQNSISYDVDMNITHQATWEYNTNGLVSSVLHFDGDGTPLTVSDYSIEYDSESRVSKIIEWNCVRDFTYSGNMVSDVATFSNSSDIFTRNYLLNDENKIYQYHFDNGTNTTTVNFNYENNRVVSGEFIRNGTNIFTVVYEYDSTPSLGYSFHKIMKNMYGSSNNAIFTSSVSIEAQISMFYGEENTALIDYSVASSPTGLTNSFLYTTDSEGYLSEYDLITNNDLYCKVKLTYEE